MPEPLDTFAGFLADTGYPDLPRNAIERARQVVADTVAAIVGGSAEPEVRAYTERMLGTSAGVATVLGVGARVSAGSAALANGTAGTFLEMDEGNQFCRGHPAIHAFPAALAAVESGEHHGRDLLVALVLGYEAGARIGIGADLRGSMHPHGTWGAVGAAVSVARLAGADAAEMREVINVASTLGLGTSRQTMLQGATVRNVYAGVAGQLGILAWDLVRSGFTGERDGLATVWGSVHSERWNPAALTDELGTRFEIARNYFKRHACCRYNHAALDALANVRDAHRFDVDQIARVRVETYALAAELVDREPRNTLAGKFSVPFAIATTLVNGSSGLSSFTREALEREETRALARRVDVAEDPSLTAMLPDRRPARVIVELADGRALEGYTSTNRGDTEDPYPQSVLTEKYFELTTRVWTEAEAGRVFEAAMGLDRLTDARELTRAMPDGS